MELNHLFNQKISVIEKPYQKNSLSQILNAVIIETLSGMNRPIIGITLYYLVLIR